MIAAERKFYPKFQCFGKATGAISPRITQRSNGFSQGFSFSLQSTLGILSAWTRFIESTPTSQNSSLSTGGFLDDNNMRCVASTAADAVDGLQKAWSRSLQFDELSGIRVNISKTSCFGNARPCRILLGHAFCPFSRRGGHSQWRF